MSYAKSVNMLRLQQLVGEGPKCLIDLMRIDPTVNWSKVINNAVSLDYIVGVGYFEGDGRKWKIYDLVSSETRDELKSQVPLGPAPACFTEQAFARWKTEVRDSKDYTTVCMDCDESSSYTKRVRKEGRCHKEVWQDIFFGRKPNRQPANV